ncbi:hypothetical protein RUM43_006832 [Polyplax serrata]|uniref:Fumarylacetoacetase-like C-terminal domain-containing protein n=1 Tax=Polyplax serrata TaxID=468196 RepID=A0AAN8S548_POLSC
MRFLQFYHNSAVQRLGIQLKHGGSIVDLNAADSELPNTLLEFLKGGQKFLEKAKVVAGESKSTIPLSEVKLLPPISNPDKIACVGLNYKGHCKENNLPIPKQPIFFSKFSSCIIGPYDNIKYPEASNKVDWEVELAVVIGKEGYNISESDAMDHVFGYTIAQDISARDWQKELNGGQFLLGKAMDTFCPIGPVVVTKESISSVYDLGLRTKVNDIVKQDSRTDDMIYKIDYLISRFSKCITLLPGDIILTGTPQGVGAAFKPPQFLKPGDIVTSEIDEIGFIKNKVVKTAK